MCYDEDDSAGITVVLYMMLLFLQLLQCPVYIPVV